jgi:hypothetical protein
MRLFLFFLAALFSATASVGSDEACRALLIGRWQQQIKVDGKDGYSVTIFRDDGRFSQAATLMRNGSLKSVFFAGTWAVSGDKITYVPTAGSMEQLPPSVTDQIIRVNMDEFIYDYRGNVQRKTRMDPVSASQRQLTDQCNPWRGREE